MITESPSAIGAQPGQAVSVVRLAGLDWKEVVHGIAGRWGGVSQGPFASLNLSKKTGDDAQHVDTNRALFREYLRAPEAGMVLGRLTHGTAVATFRQGATLPDLHRQEPDWPAFSADAAISDIPGLTVVMTFADCVPILVWDSSHRACALSHGGWRGTAECIASKTIGRLKATFGAQPSDLRVGIGPSIGPCCYAVGADVVAAFHQGYGAESKQFINDHMLDLWSANLHDLESAGVHRKAVESLATCTSCHQEAYFSHRAESGRTGRFGAAIGIAALPLPDLPIG